MTQTAASYLHPHTLASVSSVELRARMIVEGLLTGQHRSPYHGFSVEFAQHRPYTPGDDTRFLDWKVYAKTDKLYLKQYHQETNLDLQLLVDVSGSMAYAGTEAGASTPAAWRKFDHAASLAAAMTHLGLRQQDRVGLALFDDRLRSATRLSNSDRHWRSIVETLNTASLPDPKQPRELPDATQSDETATTDFSALFDQITARLHQRSLIVLISDFFDDPAALDRGLAMLQHRRHDVILLHTLDPAELEFPFRSPSEFIGLEAEGRLPLDPAALREQYLRILRQHLDEVEAVARKYRFDYLLVNTAEPVGPPLSYFLAQRAAAIGRTHA